jgi:hypothetical protein
MVVNSAELPAHTVLVAGETTQVGHGAQKMLAEHWWLTMTGTPLLVKAQTPCSLVATAELTVNETVWVVVSLHVTVVS